MVRQLILILRAVAPLIVAWCAVEYEPQLTRLAGERQAILPLTAFVVLAAVVLPMLRQSLVIVLCYGVAFLALRDITRVGMDPLPAALNYDFIDQARPTVLVLTAGLAATAAVGETFRPGAIWARRCYFGAAALYFTGIGAVHYGKYGSVQAVLLLLTGLTALLGCIFAPMFTLLDEPQGTTVDPDNLPDTVVQDRVDAAHRRTLISNEWHEPDDTPPVDMTTQGRPDA